MQFGYQANELNQMVALDFLDLYDSCVEIRKKQTKDNGGQA